MHESPAIRVAELFAGVGGFRLALDGYHDPERPAFDMPAAGPFKTIWANQWEPPGTESKQFAARCYAERFGGELVVEDINKVLDEYEADEREIPDVDMAVGGFPCQDYSVAKTLSNARGIEGKKGVLWWDIERFLSMMRPKFVLLENVDRLLKSPATQRGRDFAIMLSCLNALGYSVEWRVVNSAEYGFPQRRKRVYIYAEQADNAWSIDERAADGVLALALPIVSPKDFARVRLSEDLVQISEHFAQSVKKSPFLTGGVAQGFEVATFDAAADYRGRIGVLGDVLAPAADVPEEFFVPEEQLDRWRYLKGGKHEERTTKQGFTYKYSEGAMAFPDLPTNPSRTILTGEGGKGPSRFKHIVRTAEGRYRRLVPEELEALQGFPRGWTAGMSDGHRAFCMGNALVVGIPHHIGCEIARRLAP